MKRFIAVLLVMGVIMTAFADVTISQIAITDSYKTASSTTILLTLSGNYGKVWFSKGYGASAISNYDLTMLTPNELVPSLNGNEGTSTSPKVYAKSTDDTSNGLYLNWNIVSAVPVEVYLKIEAPMVRNIATPTADDKIGWSVTSGTQTLSVKDDGTVSNGTAIVHTKNAEKYGEASSQMVKVETDNVWGKNNGSYSATLTALIKTNS